MSQLTSRLMPVNRSALIVLDDTPDCNTESGSERKDDTAVGVDDKQTKSFPPYWVGIMSNSVSSSGIAPQTPGQCESDQSKTRVCSAKDPGLEVASR